jgi:hypothetical protein
LEVYRRLLSDTELEVASKGGIRLRGRSPGMPRPEYWPKSHKKIRKRRRRPCSCNPPKKYYTSLSIGGRRHAYRHSYWIQMCLFSLSKLLCSIQGELLPNPNNLHNPGNHFLALSTYISSSTWYGEIRYSTNMAVILLFIPVT